MRCTSRPASILMMMNQAYSKTMTDSWKRSFPGAAYRHNRTGEDNGDAHIKRQLMGREVVVAITEGRLDFGPWEQIFYGEFDGLRQKRVLVKVIGA